MNRIETAVTAGAEDLVALDGVHTTVPVATPFVVAGVVAGAFVAGAAVGCAEGHCVQDPGHLEAPAGVSNMSVADLLTTRSAAI